MPYVRITEEDINPLASFDTIENAVLIFGFDFSGLNNLDKFYNSEGERLPVQTNCKLYTSLREFKKDINIRGIDNNSVDSAAFRPYITAVDCLTNGLPVIYCSLDQCLQLQLVPDDHGFSGANAVIYATNSETYEPDPEKIERDFILYELLSAGDYLPAPVITSEAVSTSEWDSETSEWKPGDPIYRLVYDKSASSTDLYEGYSIPANQAERIYEQFKNNDSLAENALDRLINGWVIDDETKQPSLLPQLSDRINLPFTFITTCGFESKVNAIDDILDATSDRLDFLYLYDFGADIAPETLITGSLDCIKPQNVTIIYPWGHYNTTFGLKHMPGSYAYLRAYANSIRNNKPWLAVAGINRGIIPNIRAVDWDISEPYIHALQGDEIYSDVSNSTMLRANPIVNFGPTFGKIIFGNRTCFLGNGGTALPFRSFLNVRLLLINIHKQAFASSIQHMFEPNDDIVWLSFKQKVNDLLDKMVSGRGIKWYKWYKLQSDKLGQIKAKLTIRPIEAVESFDITISMTDEDIEVEEEG